MKKPGLIWMIAFLATGAAFAQSDTDYRTFTDVKGRTISARIIDYNQSDAELLIERDDQRRSWVDATVFCRNDQTYIQDWLDSYKVLSDEALAVTIEPQESRLVKVNSRDGAKRTKSTYYCTITVEKNVDMPVEDFRIEYRLFVTDVQAQSRMDHQRQIGGEFMVGDVTDGKPLTFSTGTIDLVCEYIMQEQSNLFGTNQYEILTREDRLLGVWFKVHGSSPGSVPVVRDICIPDDLYEKVVWGSASVIMDTSAALDTQASTLASGGN